MLARLRTAVLVSSVVLCAAAFLLLLACKTKPPANQSLLDAFDSDLRTYGVSSHTDQVNYEPRSEEAEAFTGFSKTGDRIWTTTLHEPIWFDGVTMKMVVQELRVVSNESDRYPYRGTVTWVLRDAGTRRADGRTLRDLWLGAGKVFQTAYLFGKKTKKWTRAELVSP